MLTLADISEGMKDLKDWSLEMDCIVKNFEFANFKAALEFVNKVGELAEKANHHPDIMISFNIVRLSLTTKCDKGLSRRDFELAREIDKLSTN